MRWISSTQQQRDHAGLRNVCAYDGHDGTPDDPLDLDNEGSRAHVRHFTNPDSPAYGHEQQ